MLQKDWKPKNTYVMILGLGLEQWADPDDPSWARHKTLYKFFKKAGVPEGQILFWENEDGEPDRMRNKLPKFLEKTSDDSLFIFYYAGHGGYDKEEEDDFYFCHPNTDDAVYAGELFDMIEENFNGDQAILMADCCYSGTLVDWLDYRDTEIKYGVLTSATSDIVSTGNWTFTDCLLSALHGDAAIDKNKDGSITFNELCKYVIKTMKEVENQPADYACSEGFDSSFCLAVVSD